MKILKGSNDTNEIGFLIQQYSGSLTRYFENIIAEFIYTGGLTREPTQESESICQQDKHQNDYILHQCFCTTIF